MLSIDCNEESIKSYIERVNKSIYGISVVTALLSVVQ